MSPILTVVAASVTTFAATNIDDIFLLTRVATRRIVAGPDLGFAARLQLLPFRLRSFSLQGAAS
jgi:hypothetical protein